jgi:hypothetical protein
MPIDVLRLGPLAYEPLEPGARCDSCGGTGTVSVTVVHTSPEEVRRYCEACWPAARERWEVAQEERTLDWMKRSMRAGPFVQPDKPPARSSGSRSWHDVGLFIERYLLRSDGSPGVPLTDIAQAANEFRRNAPKMNGPMPERIAAFVNKYSGTAS